MKTKKRIPKSLKDKLKAGLITKEEITSLSLQQLEKLDVLLRQMYNINHVLLYQVANEIRYTNPRKHLDSDYFELTLEDRVTRLYHILEVDEVTGKVFFEEIIFESQFEDVKGTTISQFSRNYEQLMTFHFYNKLLSSPEKVTTISKNQYEHKKAFILDRLAKEEGYTLTIQ